MNICIVQARMGSTRLKGKVLKEILGIPMVVITLKRLSKSKYIDKIVLATSDKPEDDVLAKTVQEYGFTCFRGDEENVLKRYMDCTLVHGGDTIIRVTGDCPLIDPTILDGVITHHKMYGYDYTRLDVPDSFIRGFDVEVVEKSALNKTMECATEPAHKEHVTYYIYTHPEDFNIGRLKGIEPFNSHHRLCVDTIEDYELVKVVFEHFNDIYVSAIDVVNYLNDNPEVGNINSNVNQKLV